MFVATVSFVQMWNLLTIFWFENNIHFVLSIILQFLFFFLEVHQNCMYSQNLNPVFKPMSLKHSQKVMSQALLNLLRIIPLFKAKLK